MKWYDIFKKFNLINIVKDTFYRLDWRKPNKTSVKQFIKRNIDIILTLKQMKRIPLFTGNYDKIVMKSFNWVVKNIKYEKDINIFKTPEMWENVDTILYNKKSDCESMALLVIMLSIANGVNPAQLYLVAGKVKEGGHAWVEYDADYNYEFGKSYIIDPAYDPHNISPFNKRTLSKDDSRYIERWFKINSLVI